MFRVSEGVKFQIWGRHIGLMQAEGRREWRLDPHFRVNAKITDIFARKAHVQRGVEHDLGDRPGVNRDGIVIFSVIDIPFSNDKFSG